MLITNMVIIFSVSFAAKWLIGWTETKKGSDYGKKDVKKQL